MSGLSRGSGLWNGNTGLWHGNTGLWSGATGLQDGAGGAWSPLVLFAAGEQGVWYDPSDFTTMFQDTAGTNPVTAVGQRIALLLDKSKGLVLGPELVTNGDFSSGTGWILAAGASIASGELIASAVTSGTEIARQLITVTAGRTYEVRYQIKTISAGTLRLQIDQGTLVTAPSTVGSHKVVVDAGVTSRGIALVATGSTTATFDNISVKLLPGNHASRVTTAQQPILRQTGGGLYYAEFDGIDDSWVTGNINFSATDEMTVIAGARKLSDAATGVVAELTASTSANNGAFLLSAPDGAADTFAFDSKGTIQTDAVATGQAAPVTVVLTGASDISGDTVSLRVNGVLADTDTGDQGTGNYANLPLFVGRRGGTTAPLNGHLFGLIVRGKTTSGTDLTNAESYMAGKTGVTL